MAVTSSNTDLHGHGERIREELRSRIARNKKLKVLDVGTGFGINVGFLTRWVSKGSAIWTVDPSREVLADVMAKLGTEGSGRIRFVEASVDDLDFEDGFFDLVVSVMVLHHVKRLEPALREMVRVLRPGGQLIVIDYKPEASHELEFTTRHEESDFFDPKAVVKRMDRLGMMTARAMEFDDLWYLVEAERGKKKTTKKKKSAMARRHAPRDGRGRARRSGR